MDFCTELNSLLIQRNYKQIGNKFYLPNSSTRPERHPSATMNSVGNFSILPAPLDSLSKKYWESMNLLVGAMNSDNLMNFSTLQPILNLCREFFK